MAEYIEREAAVMKIRKWFWSAPGVHPKLDRDTAEDILFAIPAADVRPVVRGRWKRADPRSTVVTFRCSECNYYAHVNATNYCPNCGADMRPSEEPENLTYIPPEKRSEVDDG